MKEEIEIELNEDTILSLPEILTYQNSEDKLLVISPRTANWIVLFNKKQEKVFNLLYEKKNTLRKILELTDEENFHSVLGQIIDRNFLNNQKIDFNKPQEEGLYIYLTNNCNLACTHCYMYSGKPKINELSKNEWFDIIENANNNGINSITFTGGEVLKYKDWFDIIKYTKEKNISVTILTNGVLWDLEKIQKSKKYIDEVQISLDGIDEESNSIIRGSNNFQKALNNAKLFVKTGVKTVIATTPTLQNLKDVESNYIHFAKELLNELDSEHLYFKISQKLLTGRKINTLIKEKAKEYSKITGKLANTLYPQYTVRNFINNIEIGKGVQNCGYGGLSISSDGKFFLCNRIEELESIATNRDDFKDIMEQANYYYGWSSVDNVMPCMNCDIKYICGGGCRIDEYQYAGIQSKIKENEPLIKLYCDDDYKNKIYQNMIDSIEYTYQIQ